MTSTKREKNTSESNKTKKMINSRKKTKIYMEKNCTLFWMEKLMKLVSTITRYGGPSAVLYLKNNAEEIAGLQTINQRTQIRIYLE